VDAPLRLLYVNLSGAWGGLEMFPGELLERMRARGHEVDALVWEGGGLHRFLEERGLGAHAIAMQPRRYLDRSCRRAIRAAVRDRGAQLVHSFRSADVFHPALAARILGRLDVGLVHHLQMLPKSSRRDPAHWVTYRELDRVLTITDQIGERVKQLWPVRPDRVRTVYYGIDRAPFEAADGGATRAELGVPPGAALVGIAGQICSIKGQRLVLEAFAPLADEREDLVLLIAGTPVMDEADYASDLEARVRELGLVDRVLMPGFHADVPGLMAALDVFVLGSREEAFGRVVIEAMAGDALVVASRAGGVPEIVDDGEDGLLYTSGDRDDLERALRRALALDAGERAAMLEAARAKLADRFDPDRMTDAIEAEYRDVLARRAVAP
jgi:glycosyltransferase involved in cell wall biosynthesis